jgi:hypothetical protein
VVLDPAREDAEAALVPLEADVELADAVGRRLGRTIDDVRRQRLDVAPDEVDVGAVHAEDARLDHRLRSGGPEDGQVPLPAAVPGRDHEVAEVADVVPVQVGEEEGVDIERVDAGATRVDRRRSPQSKSSTVSSTTTAWPGSLHRSGTAEPRQGSRLHSHQLRCRQASAWSSVTTSP